MRVLGMLRGRPYKSRFQPFVAYSSRWVRAPQSGILRVDCPLGSLVSKGDRLGIISDPMGEGEEEVTAPTEGVIISVLRLPLVNKGDALFHLARLKGSKGDPGDLASAEEWDPEEEYPKLD
jgi:predicted deacylase